MEQTATTTTTTPARGGGKSAIFTCNVCGEVIKKVRQVCRVCKNFDLCESCVLANKHNAKHGLTLFLLEDEDDDKANSNTTTLQSDSRAETTTSSANSQKRVKMSKQENEALRAEMTQLVQEIEDIHARISQLATLLENKLSKQMIKGLLKPYIK